MKFQLSVISFLVAVSGLGAAIGALAEDNKDDAIYRNKVVHIEQTDLHNGCVLVDLTLETKSGELTTGFQVHKQVVACPDAMPKAGEVR